jgi:hypothetical protein
MFAKQRPEGFILEFMGMEEKIFFEANRNGCSVMPEYVFI